MSLASLTTNSVARGSESRESRGRVLIVDDEEVIASTLKEFLQGEAYEVAAAMTMPATLALIESFEPDVVLCDVQLPGGDGLTLLNRSLQVRPETLFIMITAYATVENAVAAFQRGAHDYLMKPVMFEELLAKIDRLMKVSPAAAREPGLAETVPRPRRPEDNGRPEPGDAGREDLDTQGWTDPEHGAHHRGIGH